MEFSEHSKLFVGGLWAGITEEALREYFSNKYGEHGKLEECLIIRDKFTGTAKGFGFVEFIDSSTAAKALLDHHVIHGRKVDVKPAKPRGHRQEQPNGYRSDDYIQLKTKKIFVGGLAPGITKEEFKSYFEIFGNIVDVALINDKETQKPRGFGFITFESEEAVDNVLKQNFHELKNKTVEVKRAEPKYKDMNFYDSCNTGLGGPRRRYSTGLNENCLPYVPFPCYTAFPPPAFYYGWNPYGYGAPMGGWVLPPYTSHGQNRRGGYMNFHKMEESTFLSRISTIKIEDQSSSKGDAAEPHNGEIDDSSHSDSGVTNHQNKHDSSHLKRSVGEHQKGLDEPSKPHDSC